MKILQISSSSNSKPVRKISLAEKLPFFMGKVISGGNLHPLAEDLYSVILLLYKGQEEKQNCSEKAMIKACSDLLNNGIAEWHSKENFKHFADLDSDVLRTAIWRLLEIETQDELKSRLLPTHLKKAVRQVCGDCEYSQAVGMALTFIERGLTSHSSIPLLIWNAAMKFSDEARRRIIEPSTCQDIANETPGLQLRGHGIARQNFPQRRNEHSAVQPDFALPK